MTRLAVLLLFALGGCVTKLSHPTKTEAEMKVDIDRCIDQAVATRPAKGLSLDPLGELDDAYDCLEKLGYTRGQTQQATAAAHRARAIPIQPAGNAPATPGAANGAATPCRVPCIPKS